MTRRFYITGGNNPGDPAVLSNSITDSFFTGKSITGVFKEGFRYYEPGVEWTFSGSTITIINGVPFAKDEVIIVEVSTLSEVYNDADDYTRNDPCGSSYLPDILQSVVTNVNNFFENRIVDPFSVFFDKGLYNQVGNDRLKNGDYFFTVWLVMPFTESVFAEEDVTCDIIICAKTESNYTQQEREDTNLFPRLIPIYKRLIEELKLETRLGTNSIEKVFEHKKRFLPYWGGGDVAAPGAPNLWKHNADCLMISGLKLKIQESKCCTFLTNL